MRKKPVIIGVRELEEILERYLDTKESLNYAIKILGHPGVGKSAVVREVALKKHFYFIDTRLAFKENVDLGGYPVPDHTQHRMIYFRPRFIPPEEVPEGYNGILWFLDEANRAHPTVIQTLFQIITEKSCGEHLLPEKTAIILAGNLGESDSTTITEFDDAALDGRLAVFQLKPSALEWIDWASREGIHPSVVQYIATFPERLWSEAEINPNPRGWHQVSLAVTESYGLRNEGALRSYFTENKGGTLSLLINSLVGTTAGSDFIAEITAPRLLSTEEIINGSAEKREMAKKEEIPLEDILWALSGAVSYFKERIESGRGVLGDGAIVPLANALLFVHSVRADFRISFFYLLLRDCGIFTQIPAALQTIRDEALRRELIKEYEHFLDGHGN